MALETDSANRIDAAFARLRREKKKGFIAYITAGHPSIEQSLEIALALAGAGVDVLEIGVPFSDPLADGATIQASSQHAIAAGATLPRIFKMLTGLRKVSDVPVVLFTYLNPVYAYGFERFHRDAAAAGADGLLILDLPPEEAARNEELSAKSSLRAIQLIAPTTPESRIRNIAKVAEGFIYYVSREGVTGEQAALADTITPRVAEIRKHTELPVAVGFGISSAEQAAAVARDADAVVVGSAIVRRIAGRASSEHLPAEIAAFVQPMIEAAHGAG